MLLLPEDDIAREKAATVISYGGLIAFLTDTFYGLGFDPFNAAAAARLNCSREGQRKLFVSHW